jgi:hypothetical protein
LGARPAWTALADGVGEQQPSISQQTVSGAQQ